MILSRTDIEKFRSAGALIIEPFDPQYLEPNSYGFHLGEKLICYEEGILDVNHLGPPKAEEIIIPESGLVLEPDKFYLGHTKRGWQS